MSDKQTPDKEPSFNGRYINEYWEIFENKEAIPADQQNCMRAELLKKYNRDCALLDGVEGLKKEQLIAELEQRRAEQNEQARLQEAKLKEEYRLKHVELKERADAAAERIKKEFEIKRIEFTEQSETKIARLKNEFEIKRKADAETLKIKQAQIVPAIEELPKRWWQRKPRYRKNRAYVLMEQKAALEAAKYITALEDENLKLEAELTGTDELELAIRKVITENMDCRKRGRKAKAINNALEELIVPLSAMFARRERALDELNKRLLDADNKSAFIEKQEPEQDEQARQDEQCAALELEELQHKAAEALAVFCRKRIDELQQAPAKPKRQRVRKSRPEAKESK